MLTLTRKTEYALIALTHMAGEGESCSSAREIASRYNMPVPLLMNVLKLLTQQGLAKSIRGPRGGYRLALPATEISLNDVIRAVEGPVHLVTCLDHTRKIDPGSPADTCGMMPSCPVRSPIHRVHGRLVEFLKGVTLADVLESRPDQSRAADFPLVQIAGT